MTAMTRGMGLIFLGLFLFGMSSMAMDTAFAATSASAATEPVPGLSLKDYDCKPAAKESVTELERIENRLKESERLLSKYRQFGIDQQRVPAIVFMAASEDISKAYRQYRLNWKEYFWVTFPSRITWDIMKKYVDGFWSTWINEKQAERFVLERSLVPGRSNFHKWFITNIWKPAQLRTKELFSRYEQNTVDPLKVGWAALMGELSANGLCEKKTTLASGVDCTQMLARVKKAMHEDLTNASELYVRLEGAKKDDAREIPRKLLQKMKYWKSRAELVRRDCPAVADSIDNALNHWLCGVGPSAAEKLEMMCGM